MTMLSGLALLMPTVESAAVAALVVGRCRLTL
jgi:hypothetical protein